MYGGISYASTEYGGRITQSKLVKIFSKLGLILSVAVDTLVLRHNDKKTILKIGTIEQATLRTNQKTVNLSTAPGENLILK